MKSLKNKLLISMPNMVDPYFAKSVIFICEDDTNGSDPTAHWNLLYRCQAVARQTLRMAMNRR